MEKRIILPKVNCSSGAPMGRDSSHSLFGKCRLQKMRFVDGAYDQGGAYWGCGEPMWVCEDCHGSQMFVRAATRERAKWEIRSNNDDVTITFYR